MSLEEIYGLVREELEQVERSLLEWSCSDDGFISQVVSEILNAGGKRLRPALVLISARSCNYQGERGIKLAAAVELIHTASLIHNDVIDNAGMRRGITTINSRWGDKISVLVGDYIYSRVFAVLAEDGDMEVMRSIASVTNQMTEGQLTQTLSRNDVSLSEGKYLSIIADKTASLFACSCRIGAMLGGTSDGEVEILTKYGFNLGMAFQITDDLLDLVGKEDTVGKTLKEDICEGKLTLPLIHAMRVADKRDREWMGKVFKSGQAEGDVAAFAPKLERMKGLVERYRGIEYSLEKAREYGEICKREIKALGRSECWNALALLPDYVVARPH